MLPTLTAEHQDLWHSKRALFVKYFANLTHPLLAAVEHLLLISDYACRHILLLQALLQEDDCQKPLHADDYQQLIEQLSLTLSSPTYSSMLRQFRHRHLLRIALREIADYADSIETMAAWSNCADAIIIQTQRYCEHQLQERFGMPLHASGEPAQLYVLAMGKLGGCELNFSSDIDLIFAFSESGSTAGGLESIANQQYYTKIVQKFIQLMQQVTVDGFVFRVDLRLRPNGDSGPLVCSLQAMDSYYQEQGRDWERYAMVKARVLGDEHNAYLWFSRLITPFVYRRYVDFSVIESLRSMKTLIVREIQLNPMLDDIKRGRGGIREIEFIIQCFQLIRGGRMPGLQQQNAISALMVLKQSNLLAHATVLKRAYLFLRRLENILQLQNDQQTHTLPTADLARSQVVLAMGYQSWDDLSSTIHQYQRIVSYAFHAVLGYAGSQEEDRRLLMNQLASLWQGHVETNMAVNFLTSLHFKDAPRCYQLIHSFRHAPRCRNLTQAARIRLDRFMPLLLSELAIMDASDFVLLQVLRLLENIVGRSAYLALLTENQNALRALLYCFAHSPFITTLIVEQPFLLEVLLDEASSWQPLTRKQLAQILQARLLSVASLELIDETLRQFKLTYLLLAARAELYGLCDAVRVGEFLSDVAETILGEVLTCAYQLLSVRYPDISRIKSCFSIVAYGKLGSREMNYDSDLDLVFVHCVRVEDAHLVTRLTQKILHMLTTRSQAGVLYLVDTRLRPSGLAGLLVTHLDAYASYQCTQAWTWEHQALLRGRILFAALLMKRAFYQLKQDVLFLDRNKDALREDVLNMREKISLHTEHDSIKYVAGGLVDLEFLVQFLMLSNPQKALVFATHTLTQLQCLYENQVLTKKQSALLTQAYRHCHDVLHQRLLRQTPMTSLGFEVKVQELSDSLLKNQTTAPYKS